MTKKEILDFLQSHKYILKKRYGVLRIGLFGSYAKEMATPESDIDIYVEFEERKFRKIAGTWNYLEKNLGGKIDLLYPHPEMRPSLKKSIEKEVIYG
ncbi:nucleotidyltransferase family protein [Nitratifractor salsuginis]|uniref:DNA polymerase beta domain protein region n=1 Tax=Nitratifractor salsuginis (strain DSM 16511 / JCM 12458 / E9I37-1) TaxID=749222 RepID=E6X3I3_NITSE|nr:nucleotidyltransferase family protein [Nitratifractor salsuginis]ADV46260.1 DNA polymerase beta domain protein region [Nitratifractor salsuginis DSM 16511]